MSIYFDKKIIKITTIIYVAKINKADKYPLLFENAKQGQATLAAALYQIIKLSTYKSKYACRL